LQQDENWNTVENHIKSLGKFGSYRLASKRTWAARFLAGFGPKAKSAIPALVKSLEDEDFRVRVWAHYALAVIEGDKEIHKAAIQQLAKYRTKVDTEADAALELLSKD
jgi:HEAT repeat protein